MLMPGAQAAPAKKEQKSACDVIPSYSDQKNFEIRNGVLVKYHGDDAVMHVPEGTHEETVGLHGVREIYLPESMKTICCDAIIKCKNLERIYLPSHLLTSGEKFFARYGGLRRIEVLVNSCKD